jgi:hypothetical protein
MVRIEAGMQGHRLAVVALLSVSGALCASSCVGSSDSSPETSTEAAPDDRVELDTPEAIGAAQEPSAQASRLLRQLKDALPRWHAYRYPTEHPRGEWTAHIILAREGDLEHWVDVEIQDLHSFRLVRRKYPGVPLLGLLNVAVELDEGEPIPALPIALRMDDSGHPSDGGGFFPGGSGFGGGGTAGQGQGGHGSSPSGRPRRRGGWTPPRNARYPPGIYPPGVKPPPPTPAERQRAIEEQKRALLRNAIRAWSQQVQEDVDHMIANAARNREEFREEVRKDPDCLETCKGLVYIGVAATVVCGIEGGLEKGLSGWNIMPQGRVLALVCVAIGLTGGAAMAGEVHKHALEWCENAFCEAPSGKASPPQPHPRAP